MPDSLCPAHVSRRHRFWVICVTRIGFIADRTKDADVAHAEGVLRLVGLSSDDAAEVARRPLSPLDPQPA
jgi:hypothetical protein